MRCAQAAAGAPSWWSPTAPGTKHSVEFKVEAGATRIVFTQVGFANAPIRDGHRTGWTSALDLLEAILLEKS